MENSTVFFHGKDTDPLEVRALILGREVRLYNPVTNALLRSYPLGDAFLQTTASGGSLFLRPDRSEYLELPAGHLLFGEVEREKQRTGMNLGQKMVRSRVFTFLAILLVVLTAVYFLLVSLVPYLGMKLVSREREIALGDRFHETMLQQAKLTGITEDAARTASLQAFADKLELSDEYPIRITVLKSDLVNAYAVPGGHIVVYTGILEQLRTPGELAALLSHEATHVNERHSLRSLLRSMSGTIMITVVLGDAGGVAAALAGGADNLGSLSYSRSLEEEADQKGMELMMKNRVALTGMTGLMHTLEQQGDVPGGLSFLSSHPLTRNRLKDAEAFIQAHPQTVNEREDLADIFRQLKAPEPGGSSW